MPGWCADTLLDNLTVHEMLMFTAEMKTSTQQPLALKKAKVHTSGALRAYTQLVLMPCLAVSGMHAVPALAELQLARLHCLYQGRHENQHPAAFCSSRPRCTSQAQLASN